MKTALVYRSGTRRFTVPIVSLPSGKRVAKAPEGFPGGHWSIRYWADGKIKYEPITNPHPGGDLDAIFADHVRTRVEQRAKATAGTGKKTAIFLGEKGNEWLRDLRRQGKLPMVKQCEYALESFLKVTGEKAIHVSRQHILDWHQEMTKDGLNERTRFNRHRNIVHFLKAQKITVPDMPKSPSKKGNKAVQVCTDAQMEALIVTLDPYTRMVVEIGRQLGLRKRELMYAAWSDVNWEMKVFTVREKPDAGFTIKNRKERSIPMSGSLLQLLKEWQSTNGQHRWILATRTGKVNHSQLKRLKDRVEKAGLPMKDFSLHMLRRKFLTVALRKGVDVATVSKLAGHSSIEVTSRYLAAKDAEEMHDTMNDIFGK